MSEKNKRVHIELTAPLSEMGDAIELSSLVKVDPDFLSDVTQDDADPKFVISVISEQQSQKKVNYDYDAFQLIAKEVNDKKPTGYLGHISDKDKDTAFPMPQVLWLGSSVFKDASGKAKIVSKGYLIPEGTAKDLIKRKVLTTVSWSGDAILSPVREGGYKIKEFILESIDFARKNREGMPNQNLVLVTEMGDELDDGGKKKVEDEDKTYEKIVTQLTVTELKTHNPALYKSVIEMGKDEVAGETAVAVKAKEDELTVKHDAEVAALPEVSTMQKIKELLGVDKIEDSFDAVAALIEKLDDAAKEAVKNWFNSEILAKKVPNERARKLIGRLIPVTEMQGDWRSDKGVEKIKTDLEDRVDDALENDDEIKMIIKEMGSGRGGLRLAPSNRTDDDDNNSDAGDDNKKIKDTNNLRAEYVSIG